MTMLCLLDIMFYMKVFSILFHLFVFVCECLLLILVACWFLYLSDNPVKHKISPLYDLFTLYTYLHLVL